MRGKGLAFQERIANVATQYACKNLLKIEAVSAPARVIGRKVIFLKNPFLDYVGVWTERQSRAVFIEAKQTKGDRLPLISDSGLSKNQYISLRRWLSYGAATFLLWEAAQQVYFVRVKNINDALAQDRKHLRADECEPIRQGTGWILFDFIVNMRKEWP